MGIGKRISRIIKSNVNDMLSAAENPDKQLDLLISEMEDSLRKAKQQLVSQIATEKRLQREMDEADELAQMWAGKAQQAVDAGHDDLAREALRKKRTYEQLGDELDEQLYQQQNAVDNLREGYKALERRLAEARQRRQDIKTQRARSAGQSAQRRGAASDIDRRPLLDRSAFDKFDEMADKVENFEAETSARDEIEEYLQDDEELAERIDRSTRREGREERGRNARDLETDIELERLRRENAEGGGRERRSRRAEREPEREAEPEERALETGPAEGERRERRSRRRDRAAEGERAPEGAADERSARGEKPDDDAGGDEDWDRRVEL